jgi:malate dehydrogenase (oxaloacetate-decarboxylating)(NADP+)
MTDYRNALDYHSQPTPGKISITPTKPCETARDLSLAYSPGVAEPCLEIADDESKVYKYTSKGNLVAVISNGTAVLGLGNIGPSASKPVMEGKGVLFKTFADIDVFDLELKTSTSEEFINAVAALAPTFGGINLEDIKAPECFEIERILKEKLDIPVFHDDQHGTAIIASAALKNALELTERKIDQIKLVVSGAGAAAVACMRLLLTMGLRKENLLMCDSKGVIFKGRTEGMNEIKEEFAVETTCRSLADAMNGADVFFGLSSKGLVSPEMLLSMNDNPIVFAMANPDPEIEYDVAKSTRPDVIMATGRSDYPNQVNNVLGFPFIFRGALDVRAKCINEEMKMAAVNALAELAKQPVPDSVYRAYGNVRFAFGTDYLIPKPFDPRVLHFVAPAVAQAAMDSEVAREKIDLNEYTLKLKAKQNQGRVILRSYYGLAKKASRKRVALPEARDDRVLKAAAMAYEEGIAEPILLGHRPVIEEQIKRLDLDLKDFQIVEPEFDERREGYIEKYYNLLQRKGVTKSDAERLLRSKHVFANMMLAEGDVEAVICGIDRYYPVMVKPILDIVGRREGIKNVAGMYLLSVKEKLFFLADVSMNITMDSQKLADVAMLTAEFAQSMDIKPHIAMLSSSNFGSLKHPTSTMVREATEIVKKRAPYLQIDGEMQADTAVVSDIMKQDYPFCTLENPANVLIFPDMQSGNIAFKLLHRLADARAVGPIILGLKKPAYALQRHVSVDEIFNMITVAVAQSALAK